MTHPHRAAGAAWLPVSGCDERCIPAASGSSWPRTVCRGLALVAVLVTVGTAALLLPVLTHRFRTRWVQCASRTALWAVGIRVRVRGPRPVGDGGVLVVANHLSWIEILALTGAAPVRLIAKREVRRWPLVGVIAGMAGTVFIDRRRLRALPATIAEVAAAMRKGNAVVVFPEGTTWCGAAAGPFRRAAFQAALDAGVPVRPVAVTLHRSGRPAQEAAFVGDETLLTSLVRVLHLSALVCELMVLPVIAPEGDRAELAARAGAAIATVTGVGHSAGKPRRTDLALLGASTPRRSAGGGAPPRVGTMVGMPVTGSATGPAH